VTGEYDRRLDDLAARLDELPPPAQAAFFAACGEALRPLPERFFRETGWGDPGALDAGLEAAWSYAATGAEADTSDLVHRLEGTTPHPDDFEDVTFVQEPIVCVDAAVRAAGGIRVPGSWIEFPLEPVKRAVCLERFGFFDVGSSERVDELLDDARMTRALDFCATALAELGRNANPADLCRWLVERAAVLHPEPGAAARDVL